MRFWRELAAVSNVCSSCARLPQAETSLVAALIALRSATLCPSREARSPAASFSVGNVVDVVVVLDVLLAEDGRVWMVLADFCAEVDPAELGVDLPGFARTNTRPPASPRTTITPTIAATSQGPLRRDSTAGVGCGGVNGVCATAGTMMVGAAAPARTPVIPIGATEGV